MHESNQPLSQQQKRDQRVMDVEEGGVAPTRKKPSPVGAGAPLTMDEDENLFELEIKNLDTNEVYKMHIPIDQPH